MCNSVPLHNRIKYQGPQLRISDGQTQVRRQSDANQTWMCWKVFVPCLHFFCSKTQTLGLRSCSLINMFSYECLCKDLGGIHQDSRCWLHLLDLHETVVCDVTQDTSFMKQPTYICKSIACWICRRNNRLRWGQIPKGHATWQTEMITSLNSDRIEKKKTKSMDFIHKTDRSRAMKRHIKVSTHTTHTCIYIYIYIYMPVLNRRFIRFYSFVGWAVFTAPWKILCYVLFISVVSLPSLSLLLSLLLATASHPAANLQWRGLWRCPQVSPWTRYDALDGSANIKTLQIQAFVAIESTWFSGLDFLMNQLGRLVARFLSSDRLLSGLAGESLFLFCPSLSLSKYPLQKGRV